MRKLILTLSLAILWTSGASLSPTWAQLPVMTYAPPNEAGAAMGHLHMNVRDIEANKKFWTALGGTYMKVGAFNVMKFPGAYVYLNLAPGSPPATGGLIGTVVNHFGFQVQNTAQSMEKWKAAGVKAELGQIPGQAYVYSPEDVKIEILQDPSLQSPIVFHHIHFFVAEAQIPEIQAWYVRMFGAKPGTRGPFQAADVPGVNLTFAKSDTPTITTKGSLLDHIGFEVKNLEAYCQKLQANGMKLERPYGKTDTGVGLAFISDPWGTLIELNEHP